MPSIPEPRRLAILADSIVFGESEAARRHKVARNTIGAWLKPLGGLGAVRSYCAAVRYAALSEIERATAQTARRRIPQFSDEHLMGLLVEMIRANKESSSQAQAQGQAQETHIWNINR